MSTLIVVEEILRERGVPMTVKEIVEAGAARLPTKSKTPDTVVARDLAMDIKKHGDVSKFRRTSPGHYTLCELEVPVVAIAEAPALRTHAAPAMPGVSHVEVSALAVVPPAEPQAPGRLAVSFDN
jgi:hypothetical protein